MAKPLTRNKQRDQQEKKIRQHITKEMKLLAQEHARIQAATKSIEKDIAKLSKKASDSTLATHQLILMHEDIKSIRDKARKLLKTGFY